MIDNLRKLYVKWLEERVINIWGFYKPITWWLHVIKARWCSRLMVRGKLFIWRVMVGALPLGDALKKNISKRSCFFYSVELEHNMHRFTPCPMAMMVWRCISLLWMSLTRVNLSSFSWVFAHIENNEPMSHFQIIFEFLRGYGSIEICRMPSLLIRKLG